MGRREFFIAAVFGQKATDYLLAAPRVVQGPCPVPGCGTVNSTTITDVNWTERKKHGALLVCERCTNIYAGRNPWWAGGNE